MVDELSATAAEEARRFEADLRGEPHRGWVAIARARSSEGEPYWAGLATSKLLSMHTWVTGATGSGKTFFVLGCLWQVLRQTNHPVVIVDLKGELAQLLIDVLVPALAAHHGSADVLRHLRIVRPFDRSFLPMLRITKAEEGVPREIQAYNLAAALEEALSDDLGTRMGRTFLRLTSLAIELDEPLTVIRQWLESPAQFGRAAGRSGDAAAQKFVRSLFARENRSSVEALLARLDTFLFLPETRLALSAPRCLSFAEALEDGITIVDLGNPPAGAERVARFWAGILVGRLSRAILSRPVAHGSRQSWIIFEEFQEALGRGQVEQFGRLLALARYKRTALWFLNQQSGQVAATDPGLVRLLRTNTGAEAAFRCSLEDARSLAHALPVAEQSRRIEEARAALIGEMTRLPDRTFYLWLKQAPYRAQKVRSPRFDLEALQGAAKSLPPDVLEQLRRGTVSVRRELLTDSTTRTRARLVETGENIVVTRAPRDADESPIPRLG